MSTLLGTTSDGRALTYDAELYEFALDGELATFGDLQMLDARNWLRWRADALRDWFRRIDLADLEACNRQARLRQVGSEAELAGIGDEGELGALGAYANDAVARSASYADAGADVSQRPITIELDADFVRSVLAKAGSANDGSAEGLITLAIKVK